MNKIKYTIRFSLIVVIIFNIACKTGKKNNDDANQGASQSTPAQNNNASIPPKTDDNALLDGNWQFAYFTMANTDAKVLFPGEKPRLFFDTKTKRFSGFAGCNNISGTINVNNTNKLEFVKPIISTRMECNANGEKLLMDYLATIQRYHVTSTSLELFNDSKPCVVFSRVSK